MSEEQLVEYGPDPGPLAVPDGPDPLLDPVGALANVLFGDEPVVKVAPTASGLGCLPASVDVSKALRSAVRAPNPRKRGGKSSRGHALVPHNSLTVRHSTVKHLYACERQHSWQWIPDKELASLWRELTQEERAAVVRTHNEERLDRSFCTELEVQLRASACHASQEAKTSLASMILADQPSMQLYKEIFIAAVEENMPMVIDMEVVAAVDGVIQDFCDEMTDRKKEGRDPTSLLLLFLTCIALVSWLVAPLWLCIVASLTTMLSGFIIWSSMPPVDPRTFAVGSELWVNYREREHVRLMWMSAMVKVFELRLLRLWERRYGIKIKVLKDLKRQQQQKAPPPMRRNGVRRRRPQHSEPEIKEDERVQEILEEPPEAPAEARRKQRKAAKPKKPPKEEEPVAKAGLDHNFLQGGLVDMLEGSLDDEDSESETRLEDHELDEALREHLKRRHESAGKGGVASQERRNQVLRTLCEKLKTQLNGVASQ